MERKLYGFLIDERILFDVRSKRIVYYCFDECDKPVIFKAASLNETQARLFSYLMMHSQKDIIEKSEILHHVWDLYGLSSSNQRLWQSINVIRKKLSYFGLHDEFIKNVHGTGYSIDKDKVLFLLVN